MYIMYTLYGTVSGVTKTLKGPEQFNDEQKIARRRFKPKSKRLITVQSQLAGTRSKYRNASRDINVYIENMYNKNNYWVVWQNI